MSTVHAEAHQRKSLFPSGSLIIGASPPQHLAHCQAAKARTGGHVNPHLPSLKMTRSTFQHLQQLKQFPIVQERGVQWRGAQRAHTDSKPVRGEAVRITIEWRATKRISAETKKIARECGGIEGLIWRVTWVHVLSCNATKRSQTGLRQNGLIVVRRPQQSVRVHDHP